MAYATEVIAYPATEVMAYATEVIAYLATEVMACLATDVMAYLATELICNLFHDSNWSLEAEDGDPLITNDPFPIRCPGLL
ncbi:hypothetical protein CDAR_503801 [Caerostris darwini]|uniref:Uncharacterized protein n=1 Tax=Caerostris darwini TaxID=1538125 RepID=A0AAV4PC41_9ARAC|nr:hypothetical protein CDAR_503801 [Caerostris darwini]